MVYARDVVENVAPNLTSVVSPAPLRQKRTLSAFARFNGCRLFSLLSCLELVKCRIFVLTARGAAPGERSPSVLPRERSTSEIRWSMQRVAASAHGKNGYAAENTSPKQPDPYEY